MKYSEKKIIGDIGELTVAKAFIKYFRWPCRQQTMDVGIDAEVEVTDQDTNATGKVIKIQVKATMEPFKDGKNTIYPEREHIDYWKQVAVPVLLCVVSLATDEILWKVIDPNDDYTTEKGAKVEFDRIKDALTPNSRAELEKLAVEGSDTIMQIMGLVERSINSFFDGSNNVIISIRDQESCDQHAINAEIIQMVHRLIQLSKRHASQITTNRVNALDRYWNRIDMELHSQKNDDFY